MLLQLWQGVRNVRTYGRYIETGIVWRKSGTKVVKCLPCPVWQRPKWVAPPGTWGATLITVERKYKVATVRNYVRLLIFYLLSHFRQTSVGSVRSGLWFIVGYRQQWTVPVWIIIIDVVLMNVLIFFILFSYNYSFTFLLVIADEWYIFWIMNIIYLADSSWFTKI